LFRLMAQPPREGEEGPSGDLPIHAAGITPAVGVATGGTAR
jgi:cytochrome d ubiquinol oxidase subunit I